MRGRRRVARAERQTAVWERQALEAMQGFVDVRAEIGAEREYSRDLRIRSLQFERLFQRAPIAMHIVDENGRITEVNQTWLDMMGYTRKEVVGKEIFQFIVKEQRENALRRFTERKRGVSEEMLTPMNGPRRYIKKDRTEILAKTIDTPYGGGFHTSFIDITEMVRHARDAGYVAMAQQVHHNLKNELDGLRGYLTGLRGEVARAQAEITILEFRQRALGLSLTPRMQELQAISARISEKIQAAEELARFLQMTEVGLLALSLESDNGEETMSLEEHLPEVIQHVAGFAWLRGKVKVDIAYKGGEINEKDGLPGPKGGLRRILFGLVGNSIDAIEGDKQASGRTEISIVIEKNAEQVKISVIDNGPGIEPALLGELRNGEMKSTKAIGTGLGLANNRKLMADAGGTLEIDSIVGQGTTVVLTWPLIEYQRPETTAEKTVNRPIEVRTELPDGARQILSKLSVVIVEDDALTRGRMQSALVALGFSFDRMASFERPSQAFEHIGETGSRIDLVVTDKQMQPDEMQGHELIPALGGQVQAVLHTSLQDLAPAVQGVCERPNVEAAEKVAPYDELKKAAVRAALKIAPDGSRHLFLSDGAEVIDPLLETPYGIFVGRLVGLTDELLGQFGPEMGIRQVGINLGQYIRELGSFVSNAAELGRFEEVTDAPLPDVITRDRRIQNVWQSLIPGDRLNLAMLVDIYLTRGLIPFQGKVLAALPTGQTGFAALAGERGELERFSRAFAMSAESGVSEEFRVLHAALNNPDLTG
ncbi:ATP-binding protein [Candidatus Margulisiibacteriota bacterium]